MAGIYIHIPFCRKKCYYCNFFSLASVKNIEDYIKAIKLEIIIKSERENEIATIYFGGGTPSIISPYYIQEIIELIKHHYNVTPNPEITIELNPDDINIAYVKLLQNTSINRVSLGIQSLHDNDLEYIGRTHNAYQSIKALENIKEGGFKNISVDMVSGIPTQSVDTLIEDIDKIIKFDIQHISAYSLTLEKNTILDNYVNKGKVVNIDEDQQLLHFEKLRDYIKSLGFIHYELSNYSKDGYVSKHNSSYWQGKAYYGFGASAHSYDCNSRSWNINNVLAYISSINKGIIPQEKEMLSIANKFNEYIMISLRTIWGCDINDILTKFGNIYLQNFIIQTSDYIKSGLLTEKNGNIYLSDKGQTLSDGIISSLFVEEE